MIDERNCTFYTEAKARGIAAQCQAGDEDGWTYTANRAGPVDFENPHHTCWWLVEVRDETGALLGNL